MQLFEIFYKIHGIRKIQHLLKPRVFPLSALEFPRNSIFHYLPSEDELGPDDKLPYFSKYKKRIPITHVLELVELSKGGRKLSERHLPLIKSFKESNKKFRLNQHAIDNFHDFLVPIVYNYAILPKLYKYIETPIASYSKWHDLNKTLYSTISKIADKSERQQFVFINVPDVIPSITNLRLYQNKLNASFVSIFDTDEKKFVMEFWKYLDGNPNSILNELTPKAIKVTNFVFFHNTNWCLLNLGVFSQWKKSKDSQSPIQFTSFQLQKLFLKLLNSIKTETVIDPEIDLKADKSLLADEVEKDNNINKDENIDDDDELDDEEFIDTDDDDANDDSDNNEDNEENDNNKIYANYDNLPIESEDLDEIFAKVDNELKEIDEFNENIYHTSHYKSVPLDTDVTVLTKDLRRIYNKKSDVLTFETKDEIKKLIYEDKTIKEALSEYLDYYSETNLMLANDYRNLLKQIQALDNLKSPYDSSKTINEFISINQEDLKIKNEPFPNLKNVPDKSLENNALVDFDQRYIKEILPKDIVASVFNIQKAGILLQDYEISNESSITGDYEIHTLKLRPIDGVSSTIRYKIPKIAHTGEFKADGKKYTKRKQRGDLPIRKIKPNIVALTSYYGKVFVGRSEKKIYDSDAWLSKQITLAALDDTNKNVVDFTPTNVFDNKFKAPRIYSGMAKYFKDLTLENYYLVFDHNERFKLFDKDIISSLEKDGSIVVGKFRNDDIPLVVDNSNTFYFIFNNDKIPIGNLAKLALIDQTKMPLDFSYVKIFRKEIPLALVLGYFLGISRLLILLDIKPDIIPAKNKVVASNDKWVLAFKDRKLVFKKDNYLANLILAGFLEYKGSIRYYKYDEFDNFNVYLNILESKGIGVRYIKEMELLEELFVDPITKSILIEMKEPVTFLGLLLRANELLTTDYHPDIQDMQYMRIKGYERIAGIIYENLVTSIRDYKINNIRGKSKIEISPFAIWRDITSDPSNVLESDINPIEVLKDQECVTYIGVGGRNKDAMSKDTRIYHKNDMGIISESTVDSGDVGINAYMVANPIINSLRGTVDSFDFNKHGSGNLLSTTANLWPGSTLDEAKRVNIAGIMSSHTVATVGYHQPYVRTGYEEVIPYRTTDLYAVVAKKPGKVISKNSDGIIVEYDDGERVGVELGIRMGSSEGTVYPHNVTTFLKEGDTFEPGDAIAYNDGFFEPDILNPKKIIWKTYMTVKTALYESTQTLEDSCSISKRVSEALTTKTTEVRSFIVNFNQSIRNVQKPGTKLGPNDILFIIEDEVTSNTDLFDEETLNTLQILSNKAPKAKIKGVLDHYEVFYNGNLEDMSPSLRELTLESNKRFAKKFKATNRPVLTGQVDSNYKVEGEPLNIDTAEIKVFINKDTKAGVGDKTIFAAQMKSVIGEVLDYPVTTETGEEIDAIFGSKSIYNRVVISPFVLGTTITLLKIIAKKAIEIYRS